jgi:hypothetical protein
VDTGPECGAVAGDAVPARASPVTKARATSHRTTRTSDEKEQKTIMADSSNFPDQPDFDDFDVEREIGTALMVHVRIRCRQGVSRCR